MSTRGMTVMVLAPMLAFVSALPARAQGAASADTAAATTAAGNASVDSAGTGEDSAAAAPTDRVAQPPDLSGMWTLDRSKSTMPDRGMRSGGAGMGGGPGGWGGGGRRPGGMGGMRGGMGGMRGERGGAGGGFFGRLPDVIKIDETHGLVTLRDSTGKALQEIATAPGDSTVPAEKSSVPRLGGRLDGSHLEIERPAPMGGTIFETYALKSDDVLEIHVKIQPDGDMPPREFVRVYHRVSAP